MDEELRRLFEEVTKSKTKQGNILDGAMDELYMIYTSLQEAGFNEVQSFDLLKTLISIGGKN